MTKDLFSLFDFILFYYKLSKEIKDIAFYNFLKLLAKRQLKVSIKLKTQSKLKIPSLE